MHLEGCFYYVFIICGKMSATLLYTGDADVSCHVFCASPALSYCQSRTLSGRDDIIYNVFYFLKSKM